MSSGLLQLTATCSGVLPPRSFCVMDSFIFNSLSTCRMFEFNTAWCNGHLFAKILSTILLTTPNPDSNKWSLMTIWLAMVLSQNSLATKYSANVRCRKTGLPSMTSIIIPVFSKPFSIFCRKSEPFFSKLLSLSFSSCCVDKIAISAAALWLSMKMSYRASSSVCTFTFVRSESFFSNK